MLHTPKTIYCALCGVYIDFPRSDHLTSPDKDWLGTALVMDAETQEEDSQDKGNGKKMYTRFVCINPLLDPSICYTATPNMEVSIPCHEACWLVARRVAGKGCLTRLYNWLSPRASVRSVRGVALGGAELNQGEKWIARDGEEHYLTHPGCLEPDDLEVLSILPPTLVAPSHKTDLFSLLPPTIIELVVSHLIEPSRPWCFGRHQFLHALRHSSPHVLRMSYFFGNAFWEGVIVREMEGFVAVDLSIVDKEDVDSSYCYRLWRTLRASPSLRNRRRISRFIAGIYGYGDVRMTKKDVRLPKPAQCIK